MTDALKLCPFCGSTNLHSYLNAPSSDMQTTEHVACLNCGCGQSSVAAWNRRAALAAPPVAPGWVPLTDEQINQITAAQWGAGLGAPYAAYRAYARAVEAAHGITAKEAP